MHQIHCTQGFLKRQRIVAVWGYGEGIEPVSVWLDGQGYFWGHAQAAAQVKRRLAELELDMDRQQGWVRGGSKVEVCSYTS